MNEFATLATMSEEAKGPSPELNFLIWAALEGVTDLTYPTEGHPMTGKGGRIEGRGPDGVWHLYAFIDPDGQNFSTYGPDKPQFTGSLDVAKTLLPVGWCRTKRVCFHADGNTSVSLFDENGLGQAAKSTTEELAFCAAALKVAAAVDESSLPATPDENAAQFERDGIVVMGLDDVGNLHDTLGKIFGEE